MLLKPLFHPERGKLAEVRAHSDLDFVRATKEARLELAARIPFGRVQKRRAT